MSSKRSLLAVGGILGCFVLLLCIGVAALAGFVYYTNVSAMRPVDRIAYVDNDLNIQVIDAQGGHHVALTADAADSQKAYLFPTWSPDSQHIAFVEVNGDQTNRVGKLSIAPYAGGKTTTIFQSSTDLPFYMYWAPDSQRITFLTQSDNDQSLMIGGADGKDKPRQLETGSPLYWAWSPDARSILLHIGGTTQDSKDAHLALLKPADGKNTQKLADGPADFQSPQFSPDGTKTLYAASSGAGKDDLFVADANGANPHSVLKYDGSIAFAWSPDGKKIASIVTPSDAQLPVYGPLTVSDTEGKNVQTITQGPVIAFYWAPDSKQIMYLTLLSTDNSSGSGSGCLNCANPTLVSVSGQQNAPIRLQWSLASLADGKSRTLSSFVPTDDMVSLLPFFDQYARSMTFWSPDSKHFVFAQSDSNSNDGIWVIDLEGNAAPRRIGDGSLAVWSWK